MASTTNAAAGLKRVLTLYRQILRAHRVRLPAPMRVLGDGYAREEFRRHLEAKTTREQWLEFGSEWSKYLGAIDPRGADAGAMPNLSGELAPEVVEAMTEEQRQMLQKLREEATSFGLGPRPSFSAISGPPPPAATTRPRQRSAPTLRRTDACP